MPALVVAVDADGFNAVTHEHGRIRVAMDGWRWARRYISADQRGGSPKTADEVVTVGDVVRLERVPAPAPEGGSAAAAAAAPGGPPLSVWRLGQIPAVEGALVSLSPDDGAVIALAGGFDFEHSKFNRVTQARRQPGSNFKPFIYSAALDAGYTPASFINDAPIVFDAPGLENVWRPENYTGRYYGPTRLRDALINSRNLVSIRLLRAIGVERGLTHATRFGFDGARLPHNLSLALGSGDVTPLEIVRGYAAFANGGFLIDPYFIDRIDTDRGETMWRAQPLHVCRGCNDDSDLAAEPDSIEELRAQVAAQADAARAPRVLGAENAWLMGSMLRDVIRAGTGRRARSLGRSDLAGKTGTTNDHRDAWFSGFNGRIVTTVWVGFDQSRSLGRDETGAQAALPMWIDYMGVALEGTPQDIVEQPQGLVTVRIDPDTGLLAGASDPDAIYETFRVGEVPKAATSGSPNLGQTRGPVNVPEQLF